MHEGIGWLLTTEELMEIFVKHFNSLNVTLNRAPVSFDRRAGYWIGDNVNS